MTDQRAPRTAIVDIGSNSIRLVIYEGPPRLPAMLFNEKVLAGLGRGLARTGEIDAGALAVAAAALARFAAITREMRCDSVRTIATAAARDARNGADLLRIARDAGLDVELLSGTDEATASGLGVVSAIPQADGIVGDLGGGSLELVRVAQGGVGRQSSFPLGVLRIASLRDKGVLERQVGRLLDEGGWTGAGRGLPFYLVGGSWRALARLDMDRTRYPLPLIHQYAMGAGTITRLGRTIAHLPKAQLKAVSGLSAGRIPTLGDAAALLVSLLRHLRSSGTIVSAYGVREGLLYGTLDAATRALDPLIVAARAEGARLGRFPEHGDLLHAWLAPLFVAETPDDTRLRHVACLLADVGWHANPEFRAERGAEVALHGNWVGVDARGRAMIAQALSTSFGAGMASPMPLPALAPEADLRRAAIWGLAIRLGQRLSAGLAGPLRRSSISADAQRVTLHLPGADRALHGEAVDRRLTALAAATGRTAAIGE